MKPLAQFIDESFGDLTDEEIQAFTDEVQAIVRGLNMDSNCVVLTFSGDLLAEMDPNGILELMRPESQVSYPDLALAINCFDETTSNEIH